MSAEVLTVDPTSGKFTEKHFGENFSFRLWVKFIDNNNEEWVGCFSKPYERGLCLALTNENNSIGFIIAGGQGYLIDLDKKQLITVLDDQHSIESAIKTSNPDYFLAGTFYNIYILNDSGLIKEITPDRMIDGIYFKKQVGTIAIGDLATAENQYEKNVDFEFDLKTFELKFEYTTPLGPIARFLNKFKG